MLVHLTSIYTPVLIRSTALIEWFDNSNLRIRQNFDRELIDKYHCHWFEENTFRLPSFYIDEGLAKVGNGRHRLTVLSRHLDEFPAAFEGYWEDFEMKKYTDNARNQSAFHGIVIRALETSEKFSLPDLEIENLGQDVNSTPY